MGLNPKPIGVLPTGNIRGYIVQRTRFVHIEAPVNGFHLKRGCFHSQISLYSGLGENGAA